MSQRRVAGVAHPTFNFTRIIKVVNTQESASKRTRLREEAELSAGKSEVGPASWLYPNSSPEANTLIFRTAREETPPQIQCHRCWLESRGEMVGH